MTCWLKSSARPFASVVLALAILIALGLTPSRTDAQALYYRSIPLGDRAMGMGGAFTGIASDPSATYYNPAGIMIGGRFQLMGSLSSIVFTRRTVDGGFNSPRVREDFESKQTTTLPSFVGTVVQFGRKRFGDHQFALAYSTFELNRQQFGAGATDIADEESLDLRLGDSFRSRWYGISFAAQATRNVSLGLTAFLAQQNGDYSEDIGLSGGGTVQPNGQRVGGDFGTISSSFSVRTYHFVFRLGALYRINPRWQIGFMFQPPGVPLSQKGSVFRRTNMANGGETSYFVFDQGDLSTRAPIPWELRTGVEFKANTLTTLSLDASVSGPVQYQRVFDTPSQLEGLDGTLGVYWANSTQRRWTPNIAIGAEHLFGKAVVSGGLFTNVSAAPNVPETSTEYRPEQVSMFGASFAIGIDTKGYRLGLGATGYFGRGDALSFTIDRDAQVTEYRRTKSTIAALVLYISGAVSVASKGAKDVQGKIKKKKKKGAEEGESGADADADTDADTDTDADAGADTDTDTGADAGAGAGADTDTPGQSETGGADGEPSPDSD
ncbi:MAG: hypothetical protein ACN4G0_01085 [Polyangiales bacterium]